MLCSSGLRGASQPFVLRYRSTLEPFALDRLRCLRTRRELPQDIRQDTAVAVVLGFLRCQQQHLDLEALLAPGAFGNDLDFARGAVVQAGDVEGLVALEPEALRVLAFRELHRQ